MPTLDRPRLVDADLVRMERGGQPVLFVTNRNRWADHGVCVPWSMKGVLAMLDGRRTVEQICEEIRSQDPSAPKASELAKLLAALDSAYVLDSDTYRLRKQQVIRDFQQSAIRRAICAGGVYPEDRDELRGFLDRMYQLPGGPGRPGGAPAASDTLGAILCPHIDYRRGRHSFAWGFKELIERSTADLFVIVATSHYSFERFVLTRKDFVTPLGRAVTNSAYVDRIASTYGSEVFRDEFAHQPEHSIELVLLMLQHALLDRRDFSIVPLLVGSFGDAIDTGEEPTTRPEIERMAGALAEAERSYPGSVCYIVSGDLAHIGPKFGDRNRVDARRADECRDEDQRILESASTGSAGALFQSVASEEDRRRICGFPPLYTVLAASPGMQGRTLWYDQFVDPSGAEIVSFASMSFDRPRS